MSENNQPVIVSTTAPCSPPSWDDCEKVFWEMQKCFGKDMVRYRELDAKYNDMLDAFEKAQNKESV